MKTHGNQPGEIASSQPSLPYVGQTCYVVAWIWKQGLVLLLEILLSLPILNVRWRKGHCSYTGHPVEGQVGVKNLSFDKIGRDRHDREKE